MKNKNIVWKSKQNISLAKVLSKITDEKIMQNFLRDVMTEKEIIEIATRLQAAKMLNEKINYDRVILKTNLSSRTVARISNWLKNGCGGYKEAIKILNNHKV
jgi:TrpR-related protein YerC/YecD